MISLSDPCCIGSLNQCWEEMMGIFVACGSSVMCFLLPGSSVEEGFSCRIRSQYAPMSTNPTCNKRDPHELSKLCPHMPQASSLYLNLQLSSNTPTETSFQMPQELWRAYIYKCLRVPVSPKFSMQTNVQRHPDLTSKLSCKMPQKYLGSLWMPIQSNLKWYPVTDSYLCLQESQEPFMNPSLQIYPCFPVYQHVAKIHY